MAAGPEYRISGPLGWLDRWLFGARYRVLWSDTLRVPVLDLRAAGALRPLGADTLAAVIQLRLADSTHADYTFRLTAPRLSPSLPHSMRTSPSSARSRPMPASRQMGNAAR